MSADRVGGRGILEGLCRDYSLTSNHEVRGKHDLLLVPTGLVVRKVTGQPGQLVGMHAQACAGRDPSGLRTGLSAQSCSQWNGG